MANEEPVIDTETPNVARAYDYYLGGGANFQADRELAQQILEVLPSARTVAVENRHFLRRSVRYLAEQGVRQFLDLGAGIPNVNPTHEVARAVQPDAKVVYVDSEAVAVTHARQQLAEDEQSLVVHAELQDVDEVLAAAGELLDFSQPVAVMMVAILHFVSEEDDPAGIVARYAEATAPGSYLILSHATADGSTGDKVNEAANLYKGRANYNAYLRSKQQVAEIVTPYELVDPGLVWTTQWRPDGEDAKDEEAGVVAIYAAVGRKTE